MTEDFFVLSHIAPYDFCIRSVVESRGGAGDTVLAAMGVAMVSGNSIRQACRFALAAARQQIADIGISMVAGDVASV
ncbi:MAG: hypothetical protein O2960_29945 [Verrucomicrobia bacterium]|nr:hypothetical protein [Verrucomicrobiota bacterium]